MNKRIFILFITIAMSGMQYSYPMWQKMVDYFSPKPINNKCFLMELPPELLTKVMLHVIEPQIKTGENLVKILEALNNLACTCAQNKNLIKDEHTRAAIRKKLLSSISNHQAAQEAENVLAHKHRLVPIFKDLEILIKLSGVRKSNKKGIQEFQELALKLIEQGLNKNYVLYEQGLTDVETMRRENEKMIKMTLLAKALYLDCQNLAVKLLEQGADGKNSGVNYACRIDTRYSNPTATATQLKVLIEKGLTANGNLIMNETQWGGVPFLSYAVEYELLDLAEFLLKNGADPHLQYRDRELKLVTPYKYAQQNEAQEFIALFDQYSNKLNNF